MRDGIALARADEVLVKFLLPALVLTLATEMRAAGEPLCVDAARLVSGRLSTRTGLAAELEGLLAGARAVWQGWDRSAPDPRRAAGIAETDTGSLRLGYRLGRWMPYLHWDALDLPRREIYLTRIGVDRRYTLGLELDLTTFNTWKLEYRRLDGPESGGNEFGIRTAFAF